MQKKALVLAVGALFVASAAMAQKGKPEPDSVIELYGKVYPEVIWPSGSGATSADRQTCTICGKPEGENSIIKRTEMESSNSRLGVRGYEKLGAELKAVFQLETEFHVDSNDSRFARRDSFVGLDHKRFGTVKLGRMDTPFKETGLNISVFGISSGNFVSTAEIVRKTGFGTSSASSFHLRRENAVQYESPEIGGFAFKAQYSTNEAKTATRDPKVYSAGVSYERGPLYLGLGYEEHHDLFGGSRNVRSAQSNFANQAVSSKDRAIEGNVGLRFGKVHRVEFDYVRKEYEESGAIAAGRFQRYENNAWLVNWQARWTPKVWTQLWYAKAEAGSCSLVAAACNTNGLETEQWSGGVAYFFSRRTFAFLIGSIIKNGYSARYNNSNLQEPSIGEDIKQVAIGLHTAF